MYYMCERGMDIENQHSYRSEKENSNTIVDDVLNIINELSLLGVLMLWCTVAISIKATHRLQSMIIGWKSLLLERFP